MTTLIHIVSSLEHVHVNDIPTVHHVQYESGFYARYIINVVYFASISRHATMTQIPLFSLMWIAEDCQVLHLVLSKVPLSSGTHICQLYSRAGSGTRVPLYTRVLVRPTSPTPLGLVSPNLNCHKIALRDGRVPGYRRVHLGGTQVLESRTPSSSTVQLI